MSFNIQSFKRRALTALLFVIIMLTGLLWNFIGFLILFIVIHFGCWYEFVKLMKKIYPKTYFTYCLLGLLYITLPILMVVHLSIRPLEGGSSNFNPLFPAGIIFSIWLNDTMAYLTGSFIGKTPFSKISPKKTWEGTIGGIIFCVVLIGFLFPLMEKKVFFYGFRTNENWFLIAAVCAVSGTLGDLLESKIKRLAGVKDSGCIMPGHGGFLDRFDSLLIAVPFAWMYIKVIFEGALFGYYI